MAKNSKNKSKFVVKKSPKKQYGALFEAVIREKVFPDSKTFLDCELKSGFRPARVIQRYLENRDNKNFDLKAFIVEHFDVPQCRGEAPARDSGDSAKMYLSKLISYSTCTTGYSKGSMLELPHPFIASGSSCELHYGPSYWQILALKELGENDLAHNIIKNLKHLTKTYGHVPSVNRSYALSRSQPPVMALLVNLLAEIKGEDIISKYADALQLEYDYYMDKSAKTKHVVKMEDGEVLNRYWDQAEGPREEHFEEDTAAAHGLDEEVARRFYRNLRTAEESGWANSSRWMASPGDIQSIRTTDILPVDLNCLMHHLEALLSRCYKEKGEKTLQDEFWTAAENRRKAIDKYFYNESLKWYTDYVISEKTCSSIKTMAGMYPFYLNIADGLRINDVVGVFESEFLSEGGVRTVVGEGPESSIGFAPLQYIAVKGVELYGKKDLANLTAQRWLDRCHAHLMKFHHFVECLDVTVAAAPPAEQQPEAEQCEMQQHPEAEQCEMQQQPEAEQCEVEQQPEAEQCEMQQQPEAEQCEVEQQPEADQCEVEQQSEARAETEARAAEEAEPSRCSEEHGFGQGSAVFALLMKDFKQFQ